MREIVWSDWSDDAFASARSSGKPILLLLGASWCRFCRELESSVLREAAVVENVEKLYVPIRVDKDRRPDVNQRYFLSGWPTLAFLTPDGGVITGGSALVDEEVRLLVAKTADWWRANQEQVQVGLDGIVAEQAAADAERRVRTADFSPAIVERVAAAILDAFDAKHGGFGTGQKFPHPEIIDFTLLYAEKTRNPAFREIAQKSLTEMAAGGLADSAGGGFFRYCATRDWRQPHTEKLLETQAGLLRNFLEGWQLFDRPDFRKVAQKTLTYLEHTLRDPESGAWFGSQAADDEYYGLAEQARADRKPPHVEHTIYAPSLAQTISSLLKAGVVLRDESATKRALEATRFLAENLYSPGRGVYHYYSDGTRRILGLLVDQIWTARALLHVVQYTGDNSWLEVVDDLIAIIVKKQSATHGGFYDIAEDDAKFGAMKRRSQSLIDNGVMAEVLVRAHCLTARQEYLDLAERTLRAFAADWPQYGYFTAGYARATELFFHPPVRVVVVGPEGDPRRAALAEMAHRTYVPSKLVLSLDPDKDAALLKRHEFPPARDPVAYVCIARSCTGQITDPAALPAVMQSAEKQRESHGPRTKR